MKKMALLFFLLFTAQICMAQNNVADASGESPLHKRSDQANALNEAIMDAQTNAVIAYGGDVNVLNVSTKEETTQAKTGSKGGTARNFTSTDKFLMQNTVSAMVRNLEIKADTIWVEKKKFKVRVTGKFEVSLKEMGNGLTDFLNKTDRKIKIELRENDCFGKVYKPMAEYINSKKNNFLFSSQPWLMGEGDYKIEINSDRAVLYDKRFSPNTVIRVYPYKNCHILTENLNLGNALLDGMISDIYAAYIYKSVK